MDASGGLADPHLVGLIEGLIVQDVDLAVAVDIGLGGVDRTA